jgi:hypothetical protein
MKAITYLLGAGVVLALSSAVWFSTSHGHVAPTEPEPALTSPCDPVYELSALPAGVVGYYHPHNPTGPQGAYGELPAGAPYHVIGRHGNDWLYLRLPEGWGYAGSGQLWVHAADVTGLDVSRVPDYAGGH